MTPREANAFLTKLGLLDRRFSYRTEVDQANAARIWASVLSDVALADAEVAAGEHYRVTREQLMPVDVVRRCPSFGVDDPVAVAARERAEWLAAFDLSEEDLARMGQGELERRVSGVKTG